MTLLVSQKHISPLGDLTFFADFLRRWKKKPSVFRRGYSMHANFSPGAGREFCGNTATTTPTLLRVGNF